MTRERRDEGTTGRGGDRTKERGDDRTKERGGDRTRGRKNDGTKGRGGEGITLRLDEKLKGPLLWFNNHICQHGHDMLIFIVKFIPVFLFNVFTRQSVI